MVQVRQEGQWHNRIDCRCLMGQRARSGFGSKKSKQSSPSLVTGAMNLSPFLMIWQTATPPPPPAPPLRCRRVDASSQACTRSPSSSSSLASESLGARAVAVEGTQTIECVELAAASRARVARRGEAKCVERILRLCGTKVSVQVQAQLRAVSHTLSSLLLPRPP